MAMTSVVFIFAFIFLPFINLGVNLFYTASLAPPTLSRREAGKIVKDVFCGRFIFL